jgi:hypothetical protein
MKRKIKITRLPNLQSGSDVKISELSSGLGLNANKMPWGPYIAGKLSEKPIKIASTIQPVPVEEANVEAERGEVVVTAGMGGVPDTFNIGGKRHYEGGTPLNLPDDSFIFSDTAKMRIKDPAILAQFGMTYKKGGNTPAEIAKKYNTAQYKKVLMDHNTDDLQRKTAEQMITNYNIKLAKLALIQESMKGFPQGIPAIAIPYLDDLNIDPSVFVKAEEPQEAPEQMMAYGGLIGKLKMRKEGGAFDMYNLPRAQGGQETGTPAEVLPGFSTFGLLSSEKSNIENQLDFMQSSSQNKAIYENFRDAFKSNNPDLMREVANKIRKMNAGTWSWDVIPWSDQDKYEDLSTILFERAKELRTPTKKPESKYDTYSKKLNDLQNFYISKRDKYSPSSLEYYQYNEQLNKLSNYKKDVESVNEPGYLYEQGLLYGRGLPYDEIDAMHYEAFKKPEKKASAPKQQTDVKVENKQPIGDTTLAQTQLQSLGTVAPADSTTLKINKTPQKVTSSQSITNQNTSNDNTALDTIYVMRNGKLVRERATFKKKFGGELDMYQDGGGKKPIDYIYDEDVDRVRPLYDTKGDIGDPIDIEEEITQEQYDELEKLRQEMIAEVGDDMTKESDKVTAFQKKYHEYLPETSRLINMKTKFRTAAGKKANKPLSDPAQNVDKYRGPITKQYEAYLSKVKAKAKEEKKQANVPYAPSKKRSTYVDPGLKYSNLAGPSYVTDQRAPTFIQDDMALANAVSKYYNLRRYAPYEAVPYFQGYESTFLDPTTELNAAMQAAMTGVQGLAQFANPQQFAAGFSNIQGQLANQATQTISRVANANVQISNEQAARNADTMNKLAELKAKATTGLYDKNTIADQQFDTSRQATVDNIIGTEIQRRNNAAMAQAASALSDQFGINPRTGGTVYFKQGRRVNPAAETEDLILSNYTKLAERFPDIADNDPYKLLDIASKMSGYGTTKKSSKKSSNDFDMYRQMMMGRGAASAESDQ